MLLLLAKHEHLDMLVGKELYMAKSAIRKTYAPCFCARSCLEILRAQVIQTGILYTNILTYKSKLLSPSNIFTQN